MNVIEGTGVIFSAPKNCIALSLRTSESESHLNKPTVSVLSPSLGLHVHSIAPKDANFILDVGNLHQIERNVHLLEINLETYP